MAKTTKAFSVLSDIASVCRAQARALPSREEKELFWTGIGISLQGVKYVCPLEDVAEILTMPSYTKLPGVGGWVNGVANVRGKLLPLLDLDLFFFSDASTQVQSRRRVLVLDQGEMYTGLIVDKVWGMQHFPLDGYTKTVEDVPDSIRPFIGGSYHREGEVWLVFRPKRLLKDARFMKLAG